MLTCKRWTRRDGANEFGRRSVSACPVANDLSRIVKQVRGDSAFALQSGYLLLLEFRSSRSVDAGLFGCGQHCQGPHGWARMESQDPL